MALRLLGCNPASLGGLWLRARSGPVRERLLAGLDSLPLPVVRLHPAMEREALDGGLDLTATLAGGTMVLRDGLLARPSVLVLSMAERCPPGMAARLAQLLDHGHHALIAIDEGADASEGLAPALADRLAEAFAERLHQRVRREFWPYAANESLSTEDLIDEKYQGIRPAPGYPACPEHSDKVALFELLGIEGRIEMALTESFAMSPAASVSGFYFANPESRYFSVGKINDDQVQSLAERKGLSVEEVSRLLSPNLV